MIARSSFSEMSPSQLFLGREGSLRPLSSLRSVSAAWFVLVEEFVVVPANAYYVLRGGLEEVGVVVGVGCVPVCYWFKFVYKGGGFSAEFVV